MKIFGSISNLVSVLFRKDSQDITVQPSQTTTYTAARAIDLPAGDTAHVLVSRTSTDTLTNKSLTSPAISSPTGIVKADVGLSNVDNTSNATERAATATLTNKTISSATNTITGLTNASIDAAAAIAVAKLAPGSAAQILTTTGGVAVWAAPVSTVSSFTADWITADGVSKVVTHSLGTKNVIIQLYDKTNDETILVNTIIRTSTSAVTLTASEAPGAAGWKVLILAI